MTAPEVEVRVPRMRYDITMPLMEGKVQVPGLRLVVGPPVQGTVMAADSPLATGDFGLVDLNMGNLLPAIEAGWEIVGLPVFSKRKPVYTYIFCRADRGIESPKDLEGKRVAAGRYRSSITIWLRGLLQHHYGVDMRTLTWVVFAGELFPIYADEAKIEMAADPKKGPFASLLDGDVDAIMTDISDGEMFRTLEGDPRVKRLFPDYVAEDRRLYKETGIYTPVHIIGMSKKLDREHPEVAGLVYTAFERAKEVATKEILDDRGGLGIMNMRERLEEQLRDWGDLFPYGVTANKVTIDTYNDYTVEQGMVRSSYEYEQMFAASTLDT